MYKNHNYDDKQNLVKYAQNPDVRQMAHIRVSPFGRPYDSPDTLQPNKGTDLTELC